MCYSSVNNISGLNQTCKCDVSTQSERLCIPASSPLDSICCAKKYVRPIRKNRRCLTLLTAVVEIPEQQDEQE